MSRFSKTVLVGLIAVFVGCAALLYFRMRLGAPTGKIEISVSDANREPPDGLPGAARVNDSETGASGIY
jgi:hypothetical protein